MKTRIVRIPAILSAILTFSIALQLAAQPRANISLAPPMGGSDAAAVAWALSSSHPNPFNPSTSITYSVTGRANMRLAVYDMLGNVVAVFIDGRVGPEMNTVQWDAASQPSGIYFWRMTVTSPDGATRSTTRKIVLAR
jgi:hypothetical protein